jgi:serine/threonine protein phosphatase 1
MRLFTRKKASNLFAIGDIHGNIRALEDLLEKILPLLSASDILVFLGDYIDRGPDVRECIDRIIRLKKTAAFSVVTLLGNHEDWMLRSYRDHTSHSWLLGMEAFETVGSYSKDAVGILSKEIQRNGTALIRGKSKLPYETFFDALPPEHLRFFQSLQRYHRVDGVLCVHAGLDTAIKRVTGQPADAFTWGSENFPEAYSGADHVVYGHHRNAILDAEGWPQPNIQANRTYGIDTISHGVLTAIRFPGGDVFQSKRFEV